MTIPVSDHHTRRHAGIRLTVAVLAAVTMIAVVVGVVVAHTATTTRRVQAVPASSPPVAPEPSPAPEPGWDTGAEQELAARPMLVLPVSAAQSHELTTRTAGPVIRLPAAPVVIGQWFPTGFPPTPEGALAQLVASDRVGVDGGDPETYARAHAELSLPGAPPVDGTGLYTLLTQFRVHAGLPAGRPQAGLTVTYDITEGLIKGVTDSGHYAVACVLGQLSIDYQGQDTAFGVGDCQALRRTGNAWQISPGPQAALAPNAWPGTDDAVNAGYRPLDGAP